MKLRLCTLILISWCRLACETTWSAAFWLVFLSTSMKQPLLHLLTLCSKHRPATVHMKLHGRQMADAERHKKMTRLPEKQHRMCLHPHSTATLPPCAQLAAACWLNHDVKPNPPSTGRMAPVMNEARSLPRKTMALATSSASPQRPMGCALAIWATCSSKDTPACCALLSATGGSEVGAVGVGVARDVVLKEEGGGGVMVVWMGWGLENICHSDDAFVMHEC